MHCKRTGEIEYDQNGKKFHLQSTCVTWKKTLKTLSFSQPLYLFSRLFPGLENCWANFKTFSRIQDSVRTLLKPREPVMR